MIIVLSVLRCSSFTFVYLVDFMYSAPICQGIKDGNEPLATYKSSLIRLVPFLNKYI